MAGPWGCAMKHDESAISVAGAPVQLYRAGTGPTVVLLHGVGPDSARPSWERVWPALTPYAHVIAPDLPGFGGSALGETVPTVAGYRAWLARFLDSCGIDAATLGGHAFGAAVALRTALDAPRLASGVVLCAPDGLSRRPAGLANHAVGRGGQGEDFGTELTQLGCPALLLAGEEDRIVPPADVHAAAGRIPEARFALVPGAGHHLPRDAPARTAAELLSFLARHAVVHRPAAGHLP